MLSGRRYHTMHTKHAAQQLLSRARSIGFGPPICDLHKLFSVYVRKLANKLPTLLNTTAVYFSWINVSLRALMPD